MSCLNDLVKIIDFNSENIDKKEVKYNTLNYSQVKEIDKIFENWCFPKEKIKNTGLTFWDLLNEVYEKYLKVLNFHPILKEFIERLDEIDWEFMDSEKLSGAVVFFGGVLMSLTHYGCVKDIDGLFMFALGYMLIDNFIDDDNISKESKYKNMKQVSEFLNGDMSSENKLVKAASNRYLSLIKRNPKSQKEFLKLFQIEIKSAIIQSNSNLNRDIYKEIALEKGGLTGTTLASILDLDVSRKGIHYEIASILQLVDDLLDINYDKENNIYTYARYDYEKGNLDTYIFNLITQINKLPNKYNFFKLVLIYMTILGIHDHKDGFSRMFLEMFEEYNIFDVDMNKDKLIELFHEKLFDYIQK